MWHCHVNSWSDTALLCIAFCLKVSFWGKERKYEMCVHLLSPIVNPYLHRNPNSMRRSPHQCRIAFVFGECYFLLFYVTLKLPELGFAVKYLFYFVVFINCELFPLLLAGILHSLPHQSWLWRTRTQHLSSQPCVWYHVLKEKKCRLEFIVCFFLSLIVEKAKKCLVCFWT